MTNTTLLSKIVVIKWSHETLTDLINALKYNQMKM